MTLLFLDIETTGVTALDDILEVAWFVTDDDGANLRGETSVSVGISQGGLKRLNANDYVLKMHTDSGLLSELEIISADEHNARLERVRQQLSQVIAREGGRHVELAGFSVHFDARMLCAAWGGDDWSAATGASHRIADVSSIVTAVKQATGQDMRPRAPTAHRAIADCYAAHRTYCACLDTIGQGYW